MGYLIFLFTVIPLTELVLLIKTSQNWGLKNTLLLVILTGTLGVILLKIQGVSILKRINCELSQRLIRSDALFDGLFIFCGGLLLITPGIITDILGLSMISPFSRNIFKYWIKRKIRKLFLEGKVICFTRLRKYD